MNQSITNPPATPPAAMNSAKPEMSHTEASWHETMAGHRAMAAAKAEGGNPSAIKALISATDGGIHVGGLNLKPATKGTVFTLQAVAVAFAKFADANHIPEADRSMLEDNLAIVVFVDPLGTHQVLQTQGILPIIEDADALQWKVSMKEAAALHQYVMDQMQLLGEISGTTNADPVPGKRVESGESNAKQNPPLEMTSPSSNGSCQSMASRSSMPSGNSLSQPQPPSYPPAMSAPVGTQAQTTPPSPV